MRKKLHHPSHPLPLPPRTMILTNKATRAGERGHRVQAKREKKGVWSVSTGAGSRTAVRKEEARIVGRMAEGKVMGKMIIQVKMRVREMEREKRVKKDQVLMMMMIKRILNIFPRKECSMSMMTGINISML